VVSHLPGPPSWAVLGTFTACCAARVTTAGGAPGIQFQTHPICLQVKLDTDKSPKTATELGIRSIPTVMIFKGGEKMDLVIGAVPKSTLVQTIDKFL
jgi:hypothetical protein